MGHIYDAKGRVLAELGRERREITQYQGIPVVLRQAILSAEDKNFFSHSGVDYSVFPRMLGKTSIRALIARFMGSFRKDASEHAAVFPQGGSTITQQLVRNLYIGSDRRTFSRKIKEACLAMKLGGKLSKNQILADYLNEIGYGNHASGIEAAAQTYFSSHARGLTLAQAALLAGLPQAPTLYDPFRFPRVAILRRNEVLRAMANAGMIDTAQLVTASASPLGLRRGVLYTTIHHPNFFGYVEQAWGTGGSVQNFCALVRK